MKLLRYGPIGQEKPGLLDKTGKIRDLSAHVKDIDGSVLSDASLAKLARLDPASLPEVAGSPRIGACVGNPQKFIAIGLNYADHAKEAGVAVPSEPEVFTKAVSCLVGPNDTVIQPKGSTKLDWEVELGIVIGTRALYVSEAEALDYVAGYCVVNDVSERNFQIERGKQWDKGKGCDTFGPTGPWLVTRDEVKDPQALSMWLKVNGKTFQNGSTKTMIFGCAHLVHYVSQYMTLMPGDIITTGTPPGVGLGVKPTPVFLKPGDVMELGIEGLGQQRQVVAAYTDA